MATEPGPPRRRSRSCIADSTERKAAKLVLQRESGPLRRTSEDLAQFKRVAVDRELEMIRLKQQVNDLLRRLGEVPPHAVDFAATTTGGDGQGKAAGAEEG